jgi:N-acetylglucosaminyldiphosphoundecaprenol N-acetyl-beta-D-mannosaminyltransferase
VHLFHRPLADDADALLDQLCAAARAGGHHHHVSLNANKLRLARTEPDVARILAEAHTAAADGASVRWLARAWGLEPPPRIAGCDLATALLQRAHRDGLRVFLFGASPAVLGRLAAQHAPVVVGAVDGYTRAHDAVAAAIEQAAPQLVLVALGSPASERFIDRYRPDAVCVGVGGTFDVLAGEVARAPRFTHGLGLEGAWRVASQPRRRLMPAVAMARHLSDVLADGPAAVGAS